MSKVYPDNYAPYAASQGYSWQPASATLLARPAYAVLNRLLKLAERLFRGRVDRYYRRLGRESMFLDFGCGAGEVLNRMRARGCITLGMDFSEHALAVVRGNGHSALPVSESGWSHIAEASVDFVRMNHVLEHLYEPADVLRRLYTKMRPGAVLHIAVPNPDGLSARLYGRYWHGLDCPRHVILFPPQVLARWLKDLGFRILEVISEPVAKDLIRSRALVGRYRYGKDHEDLDRLIYRDDLRARAAIPVLLAQLVGLPDRFHLFAAR